MKKIYLTGYTPAPTDRFGKIRTEIHKTALGAEKTIEWQKYKDIGKLIAKLKAYGSRTSIVAFIVGVEQSLKSINYEKFKPRYPLVLIFGNEVRGLSKQILKKCDQIIEIPMHGKKESLNVSVTAGIILFSV
ncbi:MAG: RNA methyltransferase, partial [Candidatus Tagabacteria bacterium CG_4_8_14_3_um_filter_41_8]